MYMLEDKAGLPISGIYEVCNEHLYKTTTRFAPEEWVQILGVIECSKYISKEVVRKLFDRFVDALSGTD